MNGYPGWLRQSSPLIERNWQHGWTTSEGPDFRSDPTSAEHSQSVGELLDPVGLKGGAWARQVHGGTVLRVTEPGFAGDADALWTDQPGLGVIGRGADCPLILVGGARSDRSRVWGFAHASWRSTVQGITTELIGSMTGAGADPTNMVAVICPSAGPCCYEVGEEVRQAARESLGPQAVDFFVETPGQITFDLWKANTAQLTSAGLTNHNIHNVRHCTICGGSLFPSYRRQGELSGRFAAVIGS